jgi:hypothetical protein
VATDEPAKPAVAVRTTRASGKKVSQTQARNLKRAKKAKEADVSLEAHVSSISSDDVSDSSLPAFLLHTPSLTCSFPSGFSKEIYRLGHRMRRVPKGCESFQRYNFDVQSLLFLFALCFCYSSDSFSSSFVAALATANARIASLEVELKALQKAYDAATTAKAVAEKLQKSALAKAKKAERALADANKKHAQREQAVAERLHTMSSAVESKFFDLPFVFSTSAALMYLLSLVSSFLFCRIYRGIFIGFANR